MMKLSRFGIFTCSSVLTSITSSSPISSRYLRPTHRNIVREGFNSVEAIAAVAPVGPRSQQITPGKIQPKIFGGE